MQFYISEHARKRIRERVGSLGGRVNAYVQTAWEQGRKLEDLPEPVQRYVSKAKVDYADTATLRVLNGYVFIFDGARLVTVYTLPLALQRAVRLAYAANSASRSAK